MSANFDYNADWNPTTKLFQCRYCPCMFANQHDYFKHLFRFSFLGDHKRNWELEIKRRALEEGSTYTPKPTAQPQQKPQGKTHW